MPKKILEKRNVPPLKSKEEMMEILFHEEYGYLPQKPDKVTWVETDNFINCFCGGKANIKKVELTASWGEKSFTFPFYASIPEGEGKFPFFVSINFRDNIPDYFLPAEEILDNGYAILSFCHNDVTRDNYDFSDGLAGVLYEDGKRGDTDAGKIAMWAWAAHRVMDYAETIDSLDKNRGIVVGHSRLGKTALLAAATDERFAGAYSNDSGCSGAAITREKEGERVKDICGMVSYWFCENYKKYIDNEDKMPFDQHYLLASIAPRLVYVASASEDIWADPVSEYLACVAASPIYDKYNKPGFIAEDRLPVIGDKFHEGSIGYHLRKGLHYIAREDWNTSIEFFNKHL